MISNRPNTLEEFFGQRRIIENLKIFLQSCIKSKKSLDHILLEGPSGTGKTSLATVIAKTLNTRIFSLNGPTLQKPSDLISVLTALKENQIVFIDEVHAVNKEILEVLYPAIEDSKINIFIGKDYNSKIINIKLPPFTLICATTEIMKLPTPFINRFPINFHFEKYSAAEIAEIIYANFIKEGMDINFENSLIIANHSRKNPRIGINIVKRMKDFYILDETITFNKETIKLILKRLYIYDYGLNPLDIKYLSILSQNGPLGLESLSHLLSTPSQTISSFIEPILLQEGLIKKTIKGRVISDLGISFLTKNLKNA